jgi:ligand-binding sensor domain-containing protein/two-component sensor histidine kinase
MVRHISSAFQISQYIKTLISMAATILAINIIVGQHENISFEHFTNDNGLSAPVTNIIQDQYGFLWLGTTDGLNRFDGRNFTVYRNIPGDTSSIVNNIINNVSVDSTGRVWVATNGGLCYYNFSDDAFHSIVFNDTLEKIDRHRVHAVTNAGDNGIWFATKTLLHKWHENEPVITISLPNIEGLTIKYILADNHLIWIGVNNGLLVYNELTKKFIQKIVTSPFSIEKNLSVTVHPIIPFAKDTFLIGTWYGGLQKVFLAGDEINGTTYIDESEMDPRKYIVPGISIGQWGQWWIGTYGTGLSLFDSKTGKFIDHFHHNPSDAKSLSDDYVNDVFTDASGIVWIGTAAGLDKFDALTQQFRSVSIPTTSDEFSVYRLPRTIIEDSNNPNRLWITVSGAGLFNFNTLTREFKLYHHDEKDPNSLPNNTIYTFYQDNAGRNWVGMKSGLCFFDEEHEKFTIPILPGNSMPQGVHKILQDKHLGFWFATNTNGVYHYDENVKKVEVFTYDESNPNSLPDNHVFCMIEDHAGNIWIGTQNRGMCYLNPSTGKFTFFEHDKKNPSSIPDNGIYDLYEDENQHLWIATENGLADMDLKDFKIKNYSTNDGLCNNDIFSITADTQHKLWFATNNGVSKFDPATHFFKNYFIQDGLPANSMSGAVSCTTAGALYFGSSGMISFCQPENMKMNKRIPPVVITNFKIFDQPAPVMRNEEMLQPVHLSYKENMITFDFAALNFTNSILNQYAYKLDGFNNDWIYCGNKQSATFTNLDGGTYTFRVKAANNDGVWNEAGTQVLLIVDPPYWKTWWFYLLCVTTVAGILYLLYRFRINQLIKLQQIRLRISRDLHDDIGSTLSSINMISSMANTINAPEKKSSELFQTISYASRQAMELMNDIVWSINPKNDRMDMIIIRMRQYASEMLEAAQIPFTLEIDEACRHIVLPADKRKDFYLIFKEAINNLAKYSQADKAVIRLSYASRILTLIISDNGLGFDTTKIFHGNGLKNMKARADMLKGMFSIHSKAGEGTTVSLQIPASP